MALDGESRIAYIAGHLTRRFDCDGELQYLYVLPAYRGGAVAPALLRRLAGWFVELGARRVCVNVGNDRAGRFYARHGARELEKHWMVWEDIEAVMAETPSRQRFSNQSEVIMAPTPLREVAELVHAAFDTAQPEGAAAALEAANVDRFGSMITLIATGSFDALADYLAPDIRFEMFAPPGTPWILRAEGREAAVAAIASNFGSVTGQAAESVKVTAQGETVMVMGRETGRWAATGAPYSLAVAQEFTFRDGLVAEFRSVVSFR